VPIKLNAVTPPATYPAVSPPARTIPAENGIATGIVLGAVAGVIGMAAIAQANMNGKGKKAGTVDKQQIPITGPEPLGIPLEIEPGNPEQPVETAK
jgi:hypothetical protein